VQVTAEHKKGRKLLAFLKKLDEADKAAGARNKSRVLIFTNKVRAAAADAAVAAASTLQASRLRLCGLRVCARWR
jgi:hypothetical protein